MCCLPVAPTSNIGKQHHLESTFATPRAARQHHPAGCARFWRAIRASNQTGSGVSSDQFLARGAPVIDHRSTIALCNGLRASVAAYSELSKNGHCCAFHSVRLCVYCLDAARSSYQGQRPFCGRYGSSQTCLPWQCRGCGHLSDRVWRPVDCCFGFLVYKRLKLDHPTRPSTRYQDPDRVVCWRLISSFFMAR